MRQIAALCVFAFLLLPTIGCGTRTAKVSGQVRYQNKPVPGGTISFKPVQPGLPIATAALDAEGRYELTVAVGEVQILVDNRQLAPRERPSAPEFGGDLKLPKDLKLDAKPGGAGPAVEPPSGKYREIPSKYYQFETSGLEHQITGEPAQTHDIELK